MLSWRIFTHYLLSRRSGALIRTIAWLSIVGIAVGVMSLMIVVSVMNGFNAIQRERHLQVEPHIVVYYQPEAGDQKSWQEKLNQLVTGELAPQITEAEIYETQDVILKSVDGGFSGAVARGLSAKGLNSLLERISHLKGEALALGSGDVVIGTELARILRVYSGFEVFIIPPETLLLAADEAPSVEKAKVRAIIDTKLSDIDAQTLYYVRGESLRSLTGSASRELGMEIRLVNGEEYEKPLALLRSKGFKAESWPERNAPLFFALKMEKAAMTTFLSLSALITSFSILTVLILLVTQKRKDIGMLMAMGLTPKETRRVFAQVGLWLSGFGMGGGLILGTLICWLIDHFPMDILPPIYYDTTIPAKVSWTMVAIVALVSLIIALLGSWFPAYLSARATPAEALRGSLRDI